MKLMLAIALLAASAPAFAQDITLTQAQHAQLIEAQRVAKEANLQAMRAVSFEAHDVNPAKCRGSLMALKWANSASSWVGDAYALAADGKDNTLALKGNARSAEIAMRLVKPCLDASN